MQNFYNKIYKENPTKWTSDARDAFAFNAINQHVTEVASMLDFGCGNGHTLRYFANKWPDTEFFGVDISGVALEIARKKLPGAKFAESIEEMPRVNVITMMGVYEHFEDLSDISKVADHLSPGGLLYVEVPNCLAYSSSKEEGWRRTTGGTGQVEWHLERASWERILSRNGFKFIASLDGKSPSWELIWLLQV